jgi:hypothetical protein
MKLVLTMGNPDISVARSARIMKTSTGRCWSWMDDLDRVVRSKRAGREAGFGVKRKADLYDFRASLTKQIIRGRTGVLKNPRTVPYIRNHIRP